jgi:hypothetical protein
MVFRVGHSIGDASSHSLAILAHPSQSPIWLRRMPPFRVTFPGGHSPQITALKFEVRLVVYGVNKRLNPRKYSTYGSDLHRRAAAVFGTNMRRILQRKTLRDSAWQISCASSNFQFEPILRA